MAEADNLSTPQGSGSGAMNRTRPPGSNGNMDYNNAGTGARTTGGSYANPNDPSQQQGYRNTNNPYGN